MLRSDRNLLHLPAPAVGVVLEIFLHLSSHLTSQNNTQKDANVKPESLPLWSQIARLMPARRDFPGHFGRHDLSLQIR